MLQCCISAKRRRHELYDNTKDFGGGTQSRYSHYLLKTWGSFIGSTDEFFDAQSDQSDEEMSDDSRKEEPVTTKPKTAKPLSVTALLGIVPLFTYILHRF